jgi:hypothetical protein
MKKMMITQVSTTSKGSPTTRHMSHNMTSIEDFEKKFPSQLAQMRSNITESVERSLLLKHSKKMDDMMDKMTFKWLRIKNQMWFSIKHGN